MMKITELANNVCDYFGQYRKNFIGEIYEDKDEAYQDIMRMLKSNPRNLLEEVAQDLYNLVLNKDLNYDDNFNQLYHSLNISRMINEFSFSKNKDVEM